MEKVKRLPDHFFVFFLKSWVTWMAPMRLNSMFLPGRVDIFDTNTHAEKRQRSRDFGKNKEKSQTNFCFFHTCLFLLIKWVTFFQQLNFRGWEENCDDTRKNGVDQVPMKGITAYSSTAVVVFINDLTKKWNRDLKIPTVFFQPNLNTTGVFLIQPEKGLSHILRVCFLMLFVI